MSDHEKEIERLTSELDSIKECLGIEVICPNCRHIEKGQGECQVGEMAMYFSVDAYFCTVDPENKVRKMNGDSCPRFEIGKIRYSFIQRLRERG
jgi:hypothetical protein